MATNSVKKVKKSLFTNRYWITGVKDRKGNIMQDRIKITEEATAFFKKLYSDSEGPVTHMNWHDSEEEQMEEFMEEEISYCIEQLKNDKSPGQDGITNELIKLAAPYLIKPLAWLFNKILGNEYTPRQWHKSIIILLPKKQNTQNLIDFRPISLLPNIYKWFMTVLKNRLSIPLKENQPVEQAGFRSDYSTNDHLHVVNQMLEKVREYGISTYLALIDFEKAFDSVRHNCIYQALLSQGVHPQNVRILRHFYSNAELMVKMVRSGPKLKMERGVRLRDPISPEIFTRV